MGFYSLKTSPTKEVPATEEAVDKVTQDEEGPAPEVNGHAEELEEKEAEKSEQVTEKEAESHSNASADTEVSYIAPYLTTPRQYTCWTQSKHRFTHLSAASLPAHK